MKFGLTDEVIHKISAVFAQHPQVQEVIIYGSRAKGNYHEGSDIDITLKGENITNALRSKIYWEIDDLNLPYLFDISIFNSLHAPNLEEHIKRVGQIFYSKEIIHQ